MFLFRYKKDGLGLGLIRVHNALLKDMVKHFESGKSVRRKIKRADKAVKKALRVAKKKKINPGLKIAEARGALEDLRDEIKFTRNALSATCKSLYQALDRIQQERIESAFSLIDGAHERFREKEIEKGVALLKKSKEELRKKVLLKSRTALFGGTSSEVTATKSEIEEYMRRRLSAKEGR